LSAEAWAIGLAEPGGPQPDAVLASAGLDAAQAQGWFGGGYRSDRLWKTAQRDGVALGASASASGGGLMPSGQRVLVVCWPAALRCVAPLLEASQASPPQTLPSKTSPSQALKTAGNQAVQKSTPAQPPAAAMWYLVLSRKRGDWTPTQQRLAGLALRRMQAVWDHPGEPGLSQLLLGRDGRVIHGDAGSPAVLAGEVGTRPAWVAELREVVAQRWEKAEANRAYDVVLGPQEQASQEQTAQAQSAPKSAVQEPDADAPAAAPLWSRLTPQPVTHGLGGFEFLETRPLDLGDAPPIGRVDDERVAVALGYLTDRYARSPGLKDVAAAVGSSPFHFHRLFSRVVGVSPKHYLLRTQLQMAKWMLRAGRLPVGDVATAAGFASHGHFTATFHRTVGESPSEYRDRHGMGDAG